MSTNSPTVSAASESYANRDQRLVIGRLFDVPTPAGPVTGARLRDQVLVYGAPKVPLAKSSDQRHVFRFDQARTLTGKKVPVGLRLVNPAHGGVPVDKDHLALGMPLSDPGEQARFDRVVRISVPEQDPEFLRIVFNNRSAERVINDARHPSVRARETLGTAVDFRMSPAMPEGIARTLKLDEITFVNGTMVDARSPEHLVSFGDAAPAKMVDVRRALLVRPVHGISPLDHLAGLEFAASADAALAPEDQQRGNPQLKMEADRRAFATHLFDYAQILSGRGLNAVNLDPRHFVLSDSQSSPTGKQLVVMNQDDVVRSDGPLPAISSPAYTAPWILAEQLRAADAKSLAHHGSIPQQSHVLGDKAMASAVASVLYAAYTGESPLGSHGSADRLTQARTVTEDGARLVLMRAAHLRSKNVDPGLVEVMSRAWGSDIDEAPYLGELKRAWKNHEFKPPMPPAPPAMVIIP